MSKNNALATMFMHLLSKVLVVLKKKNFFPHFKQTSVITVCILTCLHPDHEMSLGAYF